MHNTCCNNRTPIPSNNSTMVHSDIKQKHEYKSSINDVNLARAIEFVKSKAKEIIDNNDSPGIGVGITTKDKVLLSIGYGLEDINRKTSFTPDTTILLASVSKPISGTMVNILQKKYKDTAIIERNANIKMIDTYLTKNLKVIDLISHRSGIPTQYGTYNESIGYSRKEIIRRLRIVPNSDFRNAMHYTNLPFTQGIEIALDAVKLTLSQGYKELFNIIGMSNSSINYEPDKYKGYLDIRDLSKKSLWYPSFEYNVTQQVSAGGIYSTVNDMLKFIKFHLKQGATSDNDKIVDPRFYQGVYVDSSDDEENIIGNGLNISYSLLGGNLIKQYSYSGALENVRTEVLWSDNLNIGIFVACNSSINGIPEGITEAFLAILGGASNSEAETIYQQIDVTADDDILAINCSIDLKHGDCSSNVIPDTTNIRGVYSNNIYGNVEISADGHITIGKLDPVKLHSTDKHSYIFKLYNKFKLPYSGAVKLLNNYKIEVTYHCITAVYNLRH